MEDHHLFKMCNLLLIFKIFIAKDQEDFMKKVAYVAKNGLEKVVAGCPEERTFKLFLNFLFDITS